MRAVEIDRLNRLYNKWFKEEKTQAEQVGWSDDEDQLGRFAQFLKLQEVKSFIGSTILDVGCGDGALIQYLHEQLASDNFEYVGIDINETFLTVAREKYNRTFIRGNFLTYDFDRQFDFTYASGIFNVTLGDAKRNYEVLFETVKKMLEVTTVGVAFNFLSAKETDEFILTGNMMIYDKQKILEWCKKQNIQARLIEGYDPVDSTILLFK